MKLGVLVIAHSNVIQVCDNLKLLDSNKISIYLHIDKKVSITKSESECLSELNNLLLIDDKERIKVNWGGRSQVDVMLLLLKKALQDKEITHVTFISGSDYFISSVDLLLRFIEENDVDIVRIDRRLAGRQLRRVLNLNLYDFECLNPRNYNGFKASCIRVLLIIFKIIRIKWFDCVHDYYHGSSWLTLRRNTVERILNYTDENKSYYDEFKYSFGADEVFFHTILKRLNINILQDYSSLIAGSVDDFLHGITYIDWFGTHNSLKGGPKVLELSDINNIIKYKSRGAFFIRKVDFNNKDFIELINLVRSDD